MSVNIPNHFVSQFSADVELLLQQKSSRLRGLVRVGTHTGSKQASPVNQFGPVQGSTPVGRFAPKGRNDVEAKRRWVFPTDREINQLIDQFDMLRMIENPEPAYAENAAADIGRFFDDLIIDCLFATAAVGETGSGSEAFGNATVDGRTITTTIAADFGASGNDGLSIRKLIEIKTRFAEAEVDEDDPITLVVTPRQHANLLNQVEVVSKDFNSRPVIDGNGMVTNLLGINIVQSNRLSLESAGIRACPAFVRSGVYLGIWKDLSSRASIRNDLSGEPWQLYTCASAGATRLQQGKVLKVLCAE